MTTGGKIALVVIGLFILAALVVVGVLYAVGVSKYNGLVVLHERANEGRSRFAAAVNTATEKMKAVWTMAEQEGLLEKETYVELAKARSGYDQARDAYAAAVKTPDASILDLTSAGAAFGRSILSVRVAFEAYPQLRTSSTYQRAMIGIEEGFNEIKTALDDWIATCRGYNTERRSFPTTWFASTFFSGQFPERIAYYEGGVKEPERLKIKAEDLNPRTNREAD